MPHMMPHYSSHMMPHCVPHYNVAEKDYYQAVSLLLCIIIDIDKKQL